MLSVEEKPLAHLLECNLETLMYAHWRECSRDKEAVPFDPDWAMGATLERCGILHTFALFRDEHLIGYAGFEVSRHLHFKSTIYAFNSGIYVVPQYRGFAGGLLVTESERLLKAIGVKKITYSAPDGSALTGMLPRAGYAPSETYFTKLVE